MAVECAFNFGSAVVSLAGVALGAAVGYLSARRISDRNAWAAAAAKFRAAFAPSLAQLGLGRRHGRTTNALDIDGFLEAHLLDHAAAIEEFRIFVLSCKRSAYQEAWNDYCESAKGGIFVAETLNSADPWCVIEEKIHAVLHFAET